MSLTDPLQAKPPRVLRRWIAALLFVLGAAGIVAPFLVRDQGFTDAPRSRPPTVKIVTPPPSPPPPPPPKVEPPPPEKPEMVAQEPVAEEEPPPAETPTPEEPPADLTTNIPGNGPGLPGLGGPGAGRGNSTAAPGGRSGRGGKWGWYASAVQNTVASAVRGHPATRNASFSVQVRIWCDSDGQVSRAQLVGTTGDPQTDNALRNQVLTGLRLSNPPTDMPMPVVMRISTRRPPR